MRESQSAKISELSWRSVLPTRAVGLIADRLGKEVGQLELGASIRAGELRKMIYTKFGADLALHIMHELWRQASTNGREPECAVGFRDA